MIQRNLYKLIKTVQMVIFATLLIASLAAQGMGGGHGGNGGGGHNGGGMHDSLLVVTFSGIVSIDSMEMFVHQDSTGECDEDSSSGSTGSGYGMQNQQSNQNVGHMNDHDSTSVHLVFHLDTDYDGINDYILNFGPTWYTPEDSTLTRPENSDTITVTGYLMTESMMWDLDIVVVTELNGQIWRELPDFGGNPGMDEPEAVQIQIGRHQNYPNPFNPSTTINFEVLIASDVNVTIYDIMGRQIASLMNNHASPGVYSVIWNGKTDANVSVSSGLYLYRISTGTYAVNKMINFIK